MFSSHDFLDWGRDTYDIDDNNNVYWKDYQYYIEKIGYLNHDPFLFLSAIVTPP